MVLGQQKGYIARILKRESMLTLTLKSKRALDPFLLPLNPGKSYKASC